MRPQTHTVPCSGCHQLEGASLDTTQYSTKTVYDISGSKEAIRNHKKVVCLSLLHTATDHNCDYPHSRGGPMNNPLINRSKNGNLLKLNGKKCFFRQNPIGKKVILLVKLKCMFTP